jgi:ribonucleotide reductase beta subunit family protein with ferritin-like domain
MSRSVFNKAKGLDFTKASMFFGDDLAVQRYDTFKYPIFDKLTQQQLGFFWRPEEVSLQKDRNDYLRFKTRTKKYIYI